MTATMQTPDSLDRPAALAPWETDPEAWKAEEPQETPQEAVDRLLAEVAELPAPPTPTKEDPMKTQGIQPANALAGRTPQELQEAEDRILASFAHLAPAIEAAQVELADAITEFLSEEVAHA
jgi:hypothetical protein